MKSLLAFSFFPAFVPPLSGGEVRLFNAYLELSRHYNVTLLTSGNPGDPAQVIHHADSFREVRIPKDDAFAQEWTRLQPLAGDGDLSGPCVAAAATHFGDLHRAYLAEYASADIIVHEFPFTIGYDIFLGLDNKPRIYNSHNCESALYRKLHATAPTTDIADLVHAAEHKLLAHAALVTYCGEDDAAAFEEICPGVGPRLAYVPNGMTRVPAPPRKAAGPVRRAVFIGSGHLPNVEAARFIVDSIAPACRDITFDIIGGCLPAGDYPDNVVRHGALEADRKFAVMTAADIAINPMLSGSGSSLKIMDFVAHGLPVVSTPVGMRGFAFDDGVHCLLADSTDFTTTLRRLARQAAGLDGMADAAFALANARYSWPAIAGQVHALIDGIATGQPTPPFVLTLNDYDPFDTVGGGATRLLGLYEAMTAWASVVVLCFSNRSAIETVQVRPGITCIKVPKTAAHRHEEAEINSRFHISVNDIVALRQAPRNNALVAIYDTLRRQARIVVCDHAYMVGLPRHFGDRFVYSSHNHEYGLKKGLLEYHPDRDALLADVRRAESFATTGAALVIAVSDEDAHALLRGLDAGAPVVVVPNGATEPVPPLAADSEIAEQRITRRSVVFVGSAHMPNIEGARFITETLAPQCPDIEFHLVGSVCSAIGDVPANVVRWDVVGESLKSAILARCHAAINPMFSGGGSNIKVADYLGNGLHVVSTAFGLRGYPETVLDHVTITDTDDFADTVRAVVDNDAIDSPALRQARHALFAASLSMAALGNIALAHIRDLESPRKRMLFVTYRYTYPTLGGAEAHLAKLLAHVGHSGEFSVDVVAPMVSAIEDRERFSSRYDFDPSLGAPALPNVRFARFPLAAQDSDHALRTAWLAQPEFERQLCRQVTPARSGLAWGWGSPEHGDAGIGRWAFRQCGLWLARAGTLSLTGMLPEETTLLVRDDDGAVLFHRSSTGPLDLALACPAGGVELLFTARGTATAGDVRPLGAWIERIAIDDEPLDLALPLLAYKKGNDALQTYRAMYQAAELSRGRHDAALTTARGPHSPDLEAFITRYASAYDIIVTHNSIFRPAVAAIAAARQAGVPSLVIPHAHLDDDYYHFPDVHQCARNATLVLAAPQATCRFFRELGIDNVRYHPAGIDADETGSDADVAAFRRAWPHDLPFFLVLGRKTPSKGYPHIMAAADRLAAKHGFRLVMIGPDDDGIPVQSSVVDYLGAQPRDVVRGAIRASLGLINMSTSESFGMVLLEAWLAGRPVIANAGCAAFHDLAVHEENALLVTPETLDDAMVRLATDPPLRARLGANGRPLPERYSWASIGADFLRQCHECIALLPRRATAE